MSCDRDERQLWLTGTKESAFEHGTRARLELHGNVDGSGRGENGFSQEHAAAFGSSLPFFGRLSDMLQSAEGLQHVSDLDLWGWSSFSG